MIFFQFVFLISSVKHNELLYAAYVRPPKNPLETYPFTYLPICISDPVPGFTPNHVRRCKRSIADVPSNRFIPPQTWCTTELTPDSRAFLNFLLSKKYQLLFSAAEESTFCFLGPTNWSIFTHFNFVFLKTLNEFSLSKVIPSNPINISEQFLGFTYETSFISTPRLPHHHPIIVSFLIGAFCVVVIILIALFIPVSGKHTYLIVSRIPKHSFALVIICGSGAGIAASIFTFRIVYFFVGEYEKMLVFIIPQTVSAFVTSIVTSMLCGVWRLRDVASALYFAPLLFPSICVALLFTVQWISVSVESCMIVPLNYIFYFIVTVVFVMIPTNLIGSLITAALFKPKHHSSKKVKIAVRRLSRSRRHFMTMANSLLFFLAFPIFQLVVSTASSEKVEIDKVSSSLFPITFLLSSMAVGIASIGIKCDQDEDWAIFSFLSAAGSAVTIWIISNIWTSVVLGQTSTLHITLYQTFTGLMCLGLAIVSGSISVLTSQIWISIRGTPVKKN